MDELVNSIMTTTTKFNRTRSWQDNCQRELMRFERQHDKRQTLSIEVATEKI